MDFPKGKPCQGMVMRIGTPLSRRGRRILLLGSGELGKEIAIEAQRLGVEVVAVDRYDWAPAMHVAHRRYVLDMNDENAIKAIVRRESPDVIMPEIEAINTKALEDLEDEGFTIVPNARAVSICMNRARLKEFAKSLGLPLAEFRIAESPEEVKSACRDIGYPCLIKPEMSSSGHGHRIVRSSDEAEAAFKEAISHARGVSRKVVVEEYLDVESELTVLAYRHLQGGLIRTSFIRPIEHYRPKGVFHYVESWHPATLNEDVQRRAVEAALRIVNALGGRGIFGVEFLITRDGRALFSEVAPRPHDTGLVTIMSCDISEFEVHVRAALGLPIPEVKIITPAAAHVVLADGECWDPIYEGIADALSIEGVKALIFGKPNTYPGRRMGLVLARGNSVEEARERARRAASLIRVRCH